MTHARAMALGALALACGEPRSLGPSSLALVEPAALAAPPSDRMAAQRLAEASVDLARASAGAPIGLVATFARRATDLQASLLVTEEDEALGARRAVHADELDLEPGASHLATVVRPTAKSWPAPCRAYVFELSSPGGALARGRFSTGGCPRALEALRGRAIFHVGRGAPSLFEFEGTLAAYKRAARISTPLRAPLGREPFFLGWKAAFAGPAGVSSVRARLSEVGSGALVDERAIALDPAWDSLAGGFEIGASPAWPKAGLEYALTLTTLEGKSLAEGRLRLRAGR